MLQQIGDLRVTTGETVGLEGLGFRMRKMSMVHVANGIRLLYWLPCADKFCFLNVMVCAKNHRMMRAVPLCFPKIVYCWGSLCRGGCWLVWPPSWAALKWSWLLSCRGGCWLAAFLGLDVVLAPFMCWWVLVKFLHMSFTPTRPPTTYVNTRLVDYW